MRALIAAPALFLLMPIATADDDTATTSAVYACAEKADDTARLACYDTAVGRLKAAEEAGEVTTISRAEVEEVKRDSFGFSIPSLPKLAMPKLGGGDDDGQLDSITMKVKSYQERKTGAIITLENGQVWKQTESRFTGVTRNKPAETAEIKAGALGSFRMKINGGTAFRVKRLK